MTLASSPGSNNDGVPRRAELAAFGVTYVDGQQRTFTRRNYSVAWAGRRATVSSTSDTSGNSSL